MSRTEKKCIVASAVLHGLLVAVVVFGAAFKGKPEPVSNHRIRVIPDIFKPGPPGGGGNPNLQRTDEQVKGETLTPQPPAAPAQPQPRPPQPQAPTPRAEVPKPPVRSETARRPSEIPKPVQTTKTPTPAKPTIELTPVVRGADAKAKAKAEAEARAARDAARQQEDKHRRDLAAKIGQATKGLKAGFQSGTQVEVWGTGGPAHNDYGSTLAEAYRDYVSTVTDFSDRDFVTVVEVVVDRSGQIVRSRVVQKTGNATMDRAAQSALDKLRKNWNAPLPAEIRKSEETFTIECSFKARRATG